MNKKRVVVVCPGRGSYTREPSNYLSNSLPEMDEFIKTFDSKRAARNLIKISELDKTTFRAKTHMTGENASSLIYSCSLSDFISINKNKYDIVAICGNSMGWYISLALGNAITFENGYDIIQTMGKITNEKGEGGQIIYPIIDSEWNIDLEKKAMVLDAIDNANGFISIHLGGYIVIGGEQKALDSLIKELPSEDKYPFQIPYHSAFHTPLLNHIRSLAESSFKNIRFDKPTIPLVDGRGHIWTPWSTSVDELYDYTLNYQVTKTYDFSSSVVVALKEFSPDNIILLGPGNSLGGPVAQVLIDHSWNDLNSKDAFTESQNKDPFLISMGMEEQRDMVL